MILDITQISDILKNRPGEKLIREGKAYADRMRMHLYGEKLSEYLSLIDGFEKSQARDLRAKYAKSNKDLFARLSRPVDKVFSAKGGSVYYNLSDQQQSRAITAAQSLPGGETVRSWVKKHWMPHLLDDPFGLIVMEILPREEAIEARREGRSFVYPTYRPTSDLLDYKPDGSEVEYVIFNLSAAEKKAFGLPADQTFFRVLDDSTDRIVRWDEKETAFEVPSLTLPNYFGYVPAMRISDIINPAKDGYVLGLFDEAVELADQVLLKGSIKAVHDFLHGFPKYSEFADECPTCAGSRFHEGEKCKTCSGTGKKIMVRPSDTKLLNWPENGEPVILPNQVGGYISPDKTFHEIAKADIADLENLMHFTVWGSGGKIKTSGMELSQEGPKTATEVVDGLKPEAARLEQISEMAEKRHKFILDAVVRLNLSLPNYQGASVNYGRRYLLESADALWLRYADARAKGAPQNILDSLLNEYLDANYQSDPIGLAVAKKLMYVEPFVHYTPAQVKGLSPAESDYKAKLYFGEWLATVSEAQLVALEVAQLRELLAAYADAKQLAAPTAAPVA